MVSFPHGHSNTNSDHGSTIDRLWSDYGQFFAISTLLLIILYDLWLVVSICLGGGGRIRRFVWVDRNQSGFLEFGVQCRNIQLPDFRPARKEFFKSLFEFLVDGSGLCRGRGIGAVRNRQDPAEMLVQAGKILRLFRAWRQAAEIALRCPLHFGSLFVQSRDRIPQRALPFLPGPLLHL